VCHRDDRGGDRCIVANELGPDEAHVVDVVVGPIAVDEHGDARVVVSRAAEAVHAEVRVVAVVRTDRALREIVVGRRELDRYVAGSDLPIIVD
jgi:hypothetical protein